MAAKKGNRVKVVLACTECKQRNYDNYKNGKTDGLIRAYYESGSLKSEDNYKNGKRDGFVRAYRENGDLMFEITFQNGTAVAGFFYKENEMVEMEAPHLTAVMKSMK